MNAYLAPDQSKRNVANAIRILELLKQELKHDDQRDMVDAVLEEVRTYAPRGQFDRCLAAIDATAPFSLPSVMCPHPLVVARAEILNAIRYA